MKWNMDMKCFFKSIGRKTRLFFSLLFVWGFSQSNIQAQTEIDLVNVDFTNPNFTGFAINTRLDISEFYQGAVGQYAWFQSNNSVASEFSITTGGLSFNASNMGESNYYAALSFEIPEGVNQITVEIHVPPKTPVRCRLHKGIISENGPSEMGSYVTLKDDDEPGVISKVLTTYSNSNDVANNEIVENVDSVITPGNYIFYFGRSSSSYKLFESVRIYYTTTSSCTPLTISDGTSDLTTLNLEKAASATLSATTSDGTSVDGAWSVSNAIPADIITVIDNTVTASSDATGSATLVFMPDNNTYCEAVIPVYVAEGYAPAPTVMGENFDNSTTSWCFGEPLTVTATSTSTTGTFAYQWYINDLALAGQTQSNYSPEATGEYYCKVTYTESGYFPVTVESPHATINNLTPQIGFDITGEGMYNIGETATLRVTASGGDGSYSYQWYAADNENGDGAVAISDATSTDHSVSSTSAQTFYYFCEISSGACTETTDVQTVTFTEGPCYELIFTATSGTTWEGSYTVSGGTVNNSGDVKFTNDGFTFGGNSDLLTIALDQEIKEGTKIEITFSTNADDNNGRGISIRTSENDEVGKLTDVTKGTYTKSYIVGKDNPLIDKKQFILTRATGNNTYLKSVIVYCGKTCEPAGLAWSESEWTVEYGAQNPSFPTLENPNKLTSIQYSSLVPEVATIDEISGVLTIKGTGTTTITATYGGDDTYCSATVSYTLTVTCSDPVPFISPESGAIECTGGVELSLYYQNADGTTTDVDVTNVTAIAWYQQGADGTWQEIDGVTSDTYTATSAGIYKALVTNNCPQWTGNEAVVTLLQNDPPVVEKLTPFQYYQLDSIYAVTGRKMRHLFKVTPKGTEGNPYEVSATIHRGTTINSLLSVNWITSKNNTDTIIADYDALTAWSKNNANAIQMGDTIVVKVMPRNMCNKIDETYADSISIIVLDRSTHTIAYVVSGTDVNNFFDVTSDDIKDPLYISKLAEMGYLPTAVNGYANYKFLNYEPFDLVLLTDYPKTDGKIGSGSADAVRAGNLDNLADLVDRKPIFSLKAHMAALEKWKAKGFTGNPLTPSVNPQTEMTVLCYAHEMFKNIDMGTDENNKIITVTEGGGSDGDKALQGFATFDVVEFVNIATIDGGTQGTLVACCERQKVVESRMMVLSINNTATQLITDDGYTAIGNILEYLLITDPIYVSDCSLVFTNGLNLDGTERDGGGDGMWSNPLNWAPGFNMVPTLSHRVRIDKPCTVNVKAGVSAVSIRKDKDNNWEGSLTVVPGAKLAVAGRFREVRGRNFIDSYKIESEGSLTIKTNETAAGAFMVYDSVAPYAQVEFYSKASGAEAQQGTDVPTTAVWQYMAIPTSGYPKAVKPFKGAWMCRWDEANPNMGYPQAHWYVVRDNDHLDPFEGYALTQEKETTYQLAGFLNVHDHTYEDLTYTQLTDGDNYSYEENENIYTYPKTYPGFHLLGNSFTAPIYLDSLKREDFVDVEPTIYIYNAGTWNDWYGNNDVGDGNSTTAGQYMALPIHAGSYTGLYVIPGMQGFFVKATSGAGNGSVAIDYRNAVVRPNYYETTPTPPPVVRAPQKERSEIPMLKVKVEGKRFADDLYLLCREDWTHDYDSGYDGKKIYGDSRTPQLFAIEADDNMAVNAVDDIDGQYLGFIAGEETEYTLTFDPSTLNGQYSRLYLHDLTAGTSIDLLASDSYSFSVGKKGETRRFLISSSSTVNEEIDSGLLKGYAYDGVLYVENFTDSEGDWTVYDAMGRKIDCGTILGLGRYSYRLNLPYGTYVVYLRTNSIVKPVKVIF